MLSAIAFFGARCRAVMVVLASGAALAAVAGAQQAPPSQPTIERSRDLAARARSAMRKASAFFASTYLS